MKSDILGLTLIWLSDNVFDIITFNKSLSLKPIMLVRTKSDIENNVDESIWKKIPEYLTDISSVTNSGLKVLIEAVVKKLSKL